MTEVNEIWTAAPTTPEAIDWLNEAADAIITSILEPIGIDTNGVTGGPLFDNLNVSRSYPTNRAISQRGRKIGQYIDPRLSVNGTTEILISPWLDNEVEIGACLLHELIHAAKPAIGHGAEFQRITNGLGFEGDATMQIAGLELANTIAVALAPLGNYPFAKIDLSAQAKLKQPTRLLKCVCDSAACPFPLNHHNKPYSLRITWEVASEGTPLCGVCAARMVVIIPKGQQGAGPNGDPLPPEVRVKSEDDDTPPPPSDEPSEDSDGDPSDDAGAGDSSEGSDESDGPSEGPDDEPEDVDASGYDSEEREADESDEGEPEDAEGSGEGDETGEGTEDDSAPMSATTSAGNSKTTKGKKQQMAEGEGKNIDTVKGLGKDKLLPPHAVDLTCDCSNCAQARADAGL